MPTLLQAAGLIWKHVLALLMALLDRGGNTAATSVGLSHACAPAAGE